MKSIRILFAFCAILVAQVNCKAPERQYPASMPTPILAEVPELLIRGEKYKFLIKTIPGVECHAGVGFYNSSDKWTTIDLLTIRSNENGICQWMWESPEEAKAGFGEVRGYIEGEGQSTNIFPATFCIESCP